MTTITDVRVFDGERLLDGRHDVSVEGATISTVSPAGSAAGSATGGAAARGERVDGAGGTLLPGLVDAHVHLRGVEDLHVLASSGVTTALDMGSWPPSLIAELRAAGSTDVRATGAGAVGPGSLQARIPGRPSDSVVTDPDDGRRFVAARLGEGTDFIKVIVDPPGAGGPDRATLEAIVAAAHEAGRIVVAHAAASGAVAMAQAAGVDVLTHAPLDAAMDDAGVAEALRRGRTSVPTLTMMEAVAAAAPRPGLDYAHARETVAALHAAGVPIVLGTDANQSPGVPANVPYGESAHHELELLVGAGLSPVEALRSATSRAADRFGLADRGRVAPGLRADLLLVEGDPVSDITASRGVRRVWIAGSTTS